MDTWQIEKILAERLIGPQAKVEAFLATYLGLRPASQITIPAEFPSGAEMGQQIDANVKPDLMRIRTIKDIRKRIVAIQAVKKLLEFNFENIVEESESYKTYYRWANELGLRTNQITVRPTVHEFYMFKEKKVGAELRKLMRQREKIKRRVQKKPGPEVDNFRFAYPEEYDKKWLLQMGALLGYPDCCIDQYIDDRINGVNVESRAAHQLAAALWSDKTDIHTYFTGFFFPCTPTCDKALAQGKVWHKTFNELDPRVGKLYEQVLFANTDLVLKQPELISKYLSQFEKRKN